MIFSAFQMEDPDWLYTIVQTNGHYHKVGITAEEMMRSVLGDEEFERRKAESYNKETGDTAPAPMKPKHIQPPPILSFKRFFNLKGDE